MRKLLGLGSLCLLSLCFSAQAHAQGEYDFAGTITQNGKSGVSPEVNSPVKGFDAGGNSSFHVVATGYKHTTRANLYGKWNGEDSIETGLGLSGTTDNEIYPHQYIALDATGIRHLGATMDLWIGSIQQGEYMAIYGIKDLSAFGNSQDSWIASIDGGNTTNRLYDQATANNNGPIDFASNEADFQYSLDQYRYFAVTSTNGDVLLEDRTNSSIPSGSVTPEGSSLLLLLPGLIPVAIGLRRRQIVKSVEA